MASLRSGEMICPHAFLLPKLSRLVASNSLSGSVRVLATLGQNCGSRRISRKAIQEVDVPKACMTIDNPPGAPIALRLQASLLYGVSRAYSQQYDYLLGDAEKARLGMSILFKDVTSSDTLDPNAGKAKYVGLSRILHIPTCVRHIWNLPRTT